MQFKVLKSFVAATAIVAATATSAIAEWAPEGPIKLMIAFRAGGGVDTSARLLAEDIAANKGWEIIPENVAGRGGLAMAAALMEEPADGLAIGMTALDSLAYGLLVAQNPGMTYEDFTYLSAITGTQTALIAKADRGWTTIADVIEAARNGESIAAGAMSDKLADATYLLGEANGVEFTTVMVQGGRGGLNGVVADDLDIAWAAGPQTSGVLAGDLVNLVSAETTPLNISPDAPLLSEFGVEYDFGTKFGVVAPGGLDDEARTALQDAIVEVLNDPDSKLVEFISKAFSGPEPIAGADFDAYMAAQVEGNQALLAATE